MFIVLVGALAALALAWPAAAQVTPFPGDFHTQEITTDDGATIHFRAVLTSLGPDRATIVGHDLGTMVAYASTARYPEKTEKLVVMDAPVPGISPGTTSCATPGSGIAPAAARMPIGSSRAASASLSTASGMHLPVTPRRSTRPCGSMTPSSMPNRTRCAPPSPGSVPSLRMSRTTRQRW